MKSAAGVAKVAGLVIPHEGKVPLDKLSAVLAAGDELVLLPQIEGNYAGGDCKFVDLAITLGKGGDRNVAAPAGTAFQLPAAWEGTKKGDAAGNPAAAANGQPIWRLYRLFPKDAIMTANYTPLIWGGTNWIAPDHSQGGHPSAIIGNGQISMGALGPWGGNEFNYPKIPVLAFIAPADGSYKITGSAKSKPWEGGAKSIPLSLRKMDTQRAAEIKTIPLPRDGTPLPFEATVELSAGHELLFVPMMQDGQDNNASTITIEDLQVSNGS